MLPEYGDWKVVREIGRGAFGKVYEIQREEFGYTYKAALKILSIPRSSSDIEQIRSEGMSDASITEYYHSIVEESVKEIVLMSQMQGNSNIVSYQNHEVRKQENGPGWDIFLQMELLTPLNQYVREHGITRQEIVQLGIDVCNALELCQSMDIIHRDIKPENIFVSEQGNFKLGDFGIARTAERTMSGMSRKGTYSYMAPEVYQGETYNKSVDIYSLGLVLYRLLNENRGPFMPPYPADIHYQDQEQALMRRMSGEALPLPSKERGDLAEIVLKACSYYPENRFASPMAMRRALEAVLQGNTVYVEQPIPLRPWPSGSNSKTATANGSGEWQGTYPPQRPDFLEPLSDTKPKGGFKGLKVVAIILAAVLLLGGGGVAFAYNSMTSKVPNLVGKTEAEAIAELGECGLPYTVEEDYSGVTSPGKVLSQSPEADGRAWKKDGVAINVSMNKNEVSVPNVVGMQAEKAAATITGKGLQVKLKGKEDSSAKQGCVLNQSLEGGKTVQRGSEIELIVCVGKNSFIMPNIIDLEVAQAQKVLKEEGFTNVTKESGYNPYIVKGRVFDQNPKTGACIKADTKITVYESLGPDPKGSVPDVVGMDAEKAVDVMYKSGFEVSLTGKKDHSFQAGKVMKQSVESGTVAKKGTKIELTVCIGTDKVIMPYVVDMKQKDAETELRKAGFQSIHIEKEYHEDVEKGYVFEQSQNAGICLMPNTAVTIYVSEGYNEPNDSASTFSTDDDSSAGPIVDPSTEPNDDMEDDPSEEPSSETFWKEELSDYINDFESFHEIVGGEQVWDEYDSNYSWYEKNTDIAVDDEYQDGDDATFNSQNYFEPEETYEMKYMPWDQYDEENDDYITKVAYVYCRESDYSFYGCYVGQNVDDAINTLEQQNGEVIVDDRLEEWTEDAQVTYWIETNGEEGELLSFKYNLDGVITEIYWSKNLGDYY